MRSSLSSWARPLGIVAAVLGLAAPVRAGIDPEVEKPYEVRLVLRFGEHRLFSPTFKEEVERELREGLQAALGGMGKVDVVHDDPRLAKIEASGLAAIDKWDEADGIKTHFVLFDHEDGHYLIRSRQHDGSTGMVSRLRPPETIDDRRFVARAALLAIERDFGLIGTVLDGAEGSGVRLAFKGAAGTPLEDWVRAGDLFAVYRVVESRPYYVPLNFVQVQGAPTGNSCTCKVLSQNGGTTLAALPDRQGYRCIKLGTARAPVRLHVLRYGAPVRTPVPGVQVQVRRQSLTDNERDQGSTDKAGVYTTERKPGGLYDQVAFITLLQNSQVRAQFPFPVFSEGLTDVSIELNSDPLAQLRLSKQLWEERVFEEQQAQAALFRSLRALKQGEAALQGAQDGLRRLEERLPKLQNERAELQPRTGTTKGLDLTVGDQRLADLKKVLEELRVFIADQKKIALAEPLRRQILELMQQAQLAESAADFDKAIETFKKAFDKLKEIGEREDERRVQHLRDLEETWALKGNNHRRARDWIYNAWPKLSDASAVKAAIPQAKEAAKTCLDAQDYLTPVKLLKVANDHFGNLQRRQNELRPTAGVNKEEGEMVVQIDETLDALTKLIQEVSDSVKQVGDKVASERLKTRAETRPPASAPK